jgi:hypothetical protein
MTAINVSNFLKWTSIAIKIENPNLTRSSCMKIALKELKKEKNMRKYIHIRSIQIRKEKKISISLSILMAVSDWKKMNM